MKKLLMYAFLIGVGMVLGRLEVSLPSFGSSGLNQVAAEYSIGEPVAIYEKVMTCERVCNGNDDLVAYAWKISKDMEFMTTVTQESKRNMHAEGTNGEDGLCQWTDVWHVFKNSREFANPYRQIDKCREQFQQWRADGDVAFQLKGYKLRHQREPYFVEKDLFVGIEYK